jgi:MFS family permease
MTNKRPGIFFGWWNVLTGFFGMGLGYAMFTVFAFGTFVRPLEAEFGWSRGDMSFALTMNNIAIVIASPLLGVLIDRLGVRRVLIPSVTLMAIAVLSMTMLTGSIWHLYALYFLIPFLGAGTLPASYSRVILAWFSRRRGIALGICLSGFGVGAAVVPSFAQWMIDNYGWRMAYVGFTAAVLFIALPLAIFLFRERPEDMGLYPDGETSDNTAEDAPVTDPNIGHTLAGAARTRSFWLILVSFLLIGLGITSIIAHLVPMLIDRGVEPRIAALCMTSLGIGLIVGRLIAGALMDYFFAPWVAAFFLCGLIAGIVILATGATGGLVFVAAICIGLATGSEISEIAYICGRYFGPKAFGTIYGTLFAAFQFGSAFGAPLLGTWYDRAGNYIGVLWFVAGLVTIGTILIALLGPYPKLNQTSGIRDQGSENR